MTLDSWPEETSWKIKDYATNSAVDGASVRPGFYAYESPGATVEHALVLPKNKEYKFLLKDSIGDGLEGHVTLYAGVAGGAVLGEYNGLSTSFTKKHKFRFST